MEERSVEDRLREEYFDLQPEIRHVAEHLETEVRHGLLPILRRLDRYEQVNVTARIKACDSALDALRRRQEGATFDRDRPDQYTLTALNDLAGVRVLAFPRKWLGEIDSLLCNRFSDWTSDPVPGANEGDEPLAFKYFGFCDASARIKGEFQIVSMLVGRFWDVEHSAIYKPARELKGVDRHHEMRHRIDGVYSALRSFEDTFEKLVEEARVRSKRLS